MGGRADPERRKPLGGRIGSDNPVKWAFHAPVAQWIEQPPPKGQVGRSIRLRGATNPAIGRGGDLSRQALVDGALSTLFPAAGRGRA